MRGRRCTPVGVSVMGSSLDCTQQAARQGVAHRIILWVLGHWGTLDNGNDLRGLCSGLNEDAKHAR